eukprot:COSAG06_NODE_3_length_43832_cov_136.908399_13_plen_170_part_00
MLTTTSALMGTNRTHPIKHRWLFCPLCCVQRSAAGQRFGRAVVQPCQRREVRGAAGVWGEQGACRPDPVQLGVGLGARADRAADLHRIHRHHGHYSGGDTGAGSRRSSRGEVEWGRRPSRESAAVGCGRLKRRAARCSCWRTGQWRCAGERTLHPAVCADGLHGVSARR